MYVQHSIGPAVEYIQLCVCVLHWIAPAVEYIQLCVCVLHWIAPAADASTESNSDNHTGKTCSYLPTNPTYQPITERLLERKDTCQPTNPAYLPLRGKAHANQPTNNIKKCTVQALTCTVLLLRLRCCKIAVVKHTALCAYVLLHIALIQRIVCKHIQKLLVCAHMPIY